MYAILKGATDTISANPQGIESDSKFLGELLAVIDLCPPLLLVILQDDLAVLVRYVFQATLQTLIFRLGLAGHTNDARGSVHSPGILRKLSVSEPEFPQVFLVNSLRNPIEIKRRIALIAGSEVGNFGGDTIDGLVRQILGFSAAATGENLDQSETNRLVSASGAFTVGVQPTKKHVEPLLS